MVDDDEFAWIEEQATGDFDHLLLATSLPFALAPAIHHHRGVERGRGRGAWGRPMAWLGEKIRQGIDLEHWAAFKDSFDRLGALTESVAADHRAGRPKSVVILSGDVHHTYLAELNYRGEHAGHHHSPAWQAVCSPCATRCPATSGQPTAPSSAGPGGEQVAGPPGQGRAGRIALAGRRERFDNHLGQLELDGRAAMLRVEQAVTPLDGGSPYLESLYERQLADGS